MPILAVLSVLCYNEGEKKEISIQPINVRPVIEDSQWGPTYVSVSECGRSFFYLGGSIRHLCN